MVGTAFAFALRSLCRDEATNILPQNNCDGFWLNKAMLPSHGRNNRKSLQRFIEPNNRPNH